MVTEKAYLCETSSERQRQHCYLSYVSKPLQCLRVHRVAVVRGWRKARPIVLKI